MGRKKKEREKSVSEYVLRPKWYKFKIVLHKYKTALQWGLVFSQIAIFIVLIAYTCKTAELVSETRENTKLLREQFELSIEPRLYSKIVDEAYYREYLRSKKGVAEEKRELREEKLLERIGEYTDFIMVANPTQNMAFSVSVYVYYTREDEVRLFGEDYVNEYLKLGEEEDRLYGSESFCVYLKPIEIYVFPINRVPKSKDQDNLKDYLSELYTKKESKFIFENGYLDTPAENSYTAIIYRDLKDKSYLMKTDWRIEKDTGFRYHLKSNLYRLTDTSGVE